MSLGSIESWAWRRHGEETQRAREELNPLDRLEAEGQAKAFQEASKYIDRIRQARGENASHDPGRRPLEACRIALVALRDEASPAIAERVLEKAIEEATK